MKVVECQITGSAADFLPRKISLSTLAAAAQKCHGCTLHCRASQAVFGEGPEDAKFMLVGEQPGDQEDKTGKPFVGPAGKLLDESLAAAGIDRAKVYVTNAVKHFKWEARGKPRLHAKPTRAEVVACRPWLLEEIKLIQPRLVVCMGATAATSLLGRDFRLTQHRQEILSTDDGTKVLTTIHPSAILRIPEQGDRNAAREEFIADLRFAAENAV